MTVDLVISVVLSPCTPPSSTAIGLRMTRDMTMAVASSACLWACCPVICPLHLLMQFTYAAFSDVMFHV